jgi:hypothetical protein
MRLALRSFLVLVWGLASLGLAHATEMRFLVVRSEAARFNVPDVGRKWTPDDKKMFQPPYGRVLRGFELVKSGPNTGYWDVLIDNGQGESMGGYLDPKDVASFATQAEAEAFAEKLAGGQAHLEPVLSGARAAKQTQAASASTPTTSGHAASEKVSVAAPPKAKLVPATSATSAEAKLGSIRNKLRAELGPAFLARLGKGYLPSSGDRLKLVAACEKVLSADERAAFALVATAWAEERASVADDRCNELGASSPKELVERCREDLVGRANMLFSMKIIDNRAEPRKSHRQFTDKDFWDKSKTERVWGVVTKDRAFSSWNAGSKNFGNMLAMLLGEGDHLKTSEHVAYDRAVRAYRDFSSGRAVFQGFAVGDKLASHMLNPSEVQKIRETMKQRKAGETPTSRMVSWSIEDAMGDFKSGVHEVGVRVPNFSITLPEGKVLAKDIGHWPVYLTNVDRDDMESVRMKQGGW